MDKMHPSLTGKFAHWCPEWDGLDIDENSDEFAACLCDFGEENFNEVEAAKAVINDRIQADMEKYGAFDFEDFPKD